MEGPTTWHLNEPTVPVTRVDVNVSSEDIEASVAKFPWRSPLGLAEAVQDIIKDKVVCDIGCAEGDQLRGMQKYAKAVFGVEKDVGRASRAEGLNVIIGDLGSNIPRADVYHMWVDPDSILNIVDVLKNRECTLIASGFRCEPYMEDLARKFDAQIIEWAYNEPEIKQEPFAPWQFNYFWWAAILKFPK